MQFLDRLKHFVVDNRRNSDGMSKAGIARRLNELGVPNPTAYKRSKGFRYENPHAFMQFLDRLKHFVVDNRRNSVLHHKPFAFRYGCPFVNLVADNTLPALTHHSAPSIVSDSIRLDVLEQVVLTALQKQSHSF